MAEENLTQEPVEFWILAAVIMMIGLSLMVILISRLALKRIATQREAQRQAELQHQKDLLTSNLEVQERERKRIAADLHDELSSRLNVLRLALHKEGTPEAEQLALLDEAVTISRDIAYELYPPMLAEFGLFATVEEFVQPLQTGLKVALTNLSPTETAPLEHDKALHLFRVVQEAVNNVLKHSQASTLSIDLKATARLTVIRIQDNGVGYAVGEQSTGLGLRNLESRMQALRGQYRIRSSPQSGTTILLIVPTQNL